MRTFIAGLRFSLGQQGAAPRLQTDLTESGEVLFLKRNRFWKSQRRGKLQLVEDRREARCLRFLVRGRREKSVVQESCTKRVVGRWRRGSRTSCSPLPGFHHVLEGCVCWSGARQSRQPTGSGRCCPNSAVGVNSLSAWICETKQTLKLMKQGK